jgi:hypothetical protein
MAENWQTINAKNGCTLYGKSFIPFGKEGDMGDTLMTNFIQQQNKFLAKTKQRILHNLSDVKKIIEIVLGEEVEMDLAGTTLTDIFFNHQDKNGIRLIDAIEEKSNGGLCHFLFQHDKSEEVDKMLQHIYEMLSSIGYWDECHTHFRYLPSMPINKVGKNLSTTQPSFWTNHL